MPRLKRVIGYLAVFISVGGCENEPTAVDTKSGGIPEGWAGTPDSSWQVGLTRERHGGTYALSITGRVFAMIYQPVLATNYRGKRVRWSGWMKSVNIRTGVTSGLWMRVDDGQRALAFDNMYDRPFAGTNDWTRVSIVLDVPEDAMGISVGILFNADGRLIVDDLSLEIVDLNEPTTRTITPFAANTSHLYAMAPISPVNLDFEGTIASSVRGVP